jgi:predicted Ser/Thr protein kinase
MSDERTSPLRPHDPRALGRYELVGRLGEGGMGTVYLARGDAGVLVAVKMIRADLAPDDAFRRRFRSEVNRARQVPPFCTAEVLDADPDHEQPYLVVEYVDGPSLAEVVDKQGPLTASNLHSVAIGVATALTAIHGAGVIHRDLKPRNVLLAPGSPKVIDFGIARALEATSAHTQTDQMVGTVAYMAPERFGSDTDTPLTPAADIFAWGSVVAYAGTGRTPFSADSPPATAARILTQPPDLSGLNGPLRELIGHALEKDPANRPSARELLDLLITGPQRPAASGAALADQPGLKLAAEEAQAVTGYHSASQLTAMAAPSNLVGYDENSIVTQPVSTVPAGPETPFGHGPAPRRPWVLPVAVALLLIPLLAMAGAAWFLVPSGRSGETIEIPSTAPTVAGPQPIAPTLVDDALLEEGMWHPYADLGEQASCSFEQGLVARRLKRGTFRCRGPQDPLPDDVRAEVGVRLLTPDSCASIWLHFNKIRKEELGGYQVRICEHTVYVGTHKATTAKIYKTFPLGDRPIRVGDPSVRITVSVVGNTLEVLRGGERVGAPVTIEDKEVSSGRVVLGLFTEEYASPDGPYEVAFNDIKIWSAER